MPDDEIAVKRTNLPLKVAISNAEYHIGSGVLTVRGWRLFQGEPGTVTLRHERLGTIGEAGQGMARDDVCRDYPDYKDPNAGWLFEGVVPGLAENDRIQVVFATPSGKVYQQRALKVILAEDAERFSISECSYDTGGKFLRLAGEVYPERPPRRLRVQLGNDRTEVVEDAFLPSANETFQTGGMANKFGGFKTTVLHVGEGALSEINLVSDHIDGSETTWPVDVSQMAYDQPLAEITSVRVDYLRNRLLVEGWYRSYSPVTSIELYLGTRKCHAYPEIKEDPALTKKLHLRGPSVFSFRYDADLRASMGDDIFEAPLAKAASVSLLNRDESLGSFEAGSRVIEAISTVATNVVFDKRRSLLMVWGQCAPNAVPSEVIFGANGRTIGEPLKTTLPDLDPSAAITTWFASKEVNFELTQSHNVELVSVVGRTGRKETIAAVPKPLIVSAAHTIYSQSPAEIVDRLFMHNMEPRHLPEPVAAFVFQGSALAKGGGVTRLLAMIRAFKKAGYYTVLIDRSAPWDFLEAIEDYKVMRTYCDDHLMVPQRYKVPHLERTISHFKSAVPQSAEVRKLTGLLERSFKEGRLLKGDGKGLYARVDSQFNYNVAALLHQLRPDVAISLFAWSCEIHTALPAGTYGLIDTIDVQSMRYKNFAEARNTFGPEAVPDVEKFAVEASTEQRFLNLAQGCIAISSEEKENLDDLIGSRNNLLATFSRQDEPFLGSPEDSTSILFVGNHYEPNIHGIRYFLDEIWPMVADRLPNAHLDIVGSCGQEVTDYESDQITVHGLVQDLEPLYERAAVIINPVMFGTGVAIKMFEALSKGKASVATSVGARELGRAAENGALAIADTSKDFAQTLVGLLEDPRARAEMEEKAFAYSNTYMTSEVVYSNLFNYLETKLYYR